MWTIIFIIIRCILSFLFIGREPTTWPANNCLQISVLLDVFLYILLQIVFCSCAVDITLLWEKADRFPELLENDSTSLVDRKNSENTKKGTKVALNVFREYLLKERKVDEESLVSSTRWTSWRMRMYWRDFMLKPEKRMASFTSKLHLSG